MTADEIIEALRRAGVELEKVGAGLKARALGAPLTGEHRKLISENKAALLARLDAQPAPPPTGEKEKEDDGAIYKEFVYPNGEVLRLTRTEFQRVVSAFRMLMEQETKLILQGKRLKRL